MRRSLLLPVILVTAFSLFAYNHPEIKWKSVTTEHFIINYYDKTEPAVYAAWKISEESYKVLASLYDYKPREKIALSLAEYDDFSNGYAEWTSANIMIWLPDSRFELRSNTTWLRNVITHELAHILSLENKKKRQILDFTFGLALSTPDEEYSFIEPFATITTYPSWLAEGITQFETECLGNDCFDSRREMLLRCAVLSGSHLTLDEMGSFNHDRIGSELVYNQGFAFTRYIAGKIGTERLHGIFRRGASGRINPFSFFSEQTGLSLSNLYIAWTDSLKASYSSRFPSLSESFITRCSDGAFNQRPELSPDGKYWSWLSSGRDDGSRTDLIVAPYGATRPLLRIPYAHTAHCFSADAGRVYYVKSRTPDGNGSYFNDIFYRTVANGKERRLTSGGRIYDIAPVPGSGDLLCVSYRSGAFGLFRCNTESGFLTQVLPEDAGSPIVNISVNPHDPNLFVLSKIINGRSALFLLSLETLQLEPLSVGTAQEESPFWAPDGRIYFSADYDGVFNIYSLLPDRRDLKRHTSTGGGYFSPRIGPDGNLIAEHYSATGFSIVRRAPAAQPYSLPDIERCSFKPLPVPEGRVTIKDRPYAAKYRRGVSELFLSGVLLKNSSLFTGQSIDPLDTSSLVLVGGLSNYQTDALQKRQRLFQVRLGAQALIHGETPSADRYRRLYTQMNSGSSPFLRKAIDRRNIPARFSNQGPFTVDYPVPAASRNTAQQSDTASNDSTQTPQTFIAVAIPAIAFENRTAAPTVGIEMSTQLAMLLVPGQIQITPYIEQQFAREWSGGLRLNLQSLPFNSFPLFGSLPLYLLWSHPGIYNEDIPYNLADYLQLELSVAPQYLPGLTLKPPADSTGLSDTTASVIGGIEAQVNLFYGIPLFKYASLQWSSFTTAVYHATPTLDNMAVQNRNGNPFIHGESNSYLATLNGCKAVFPIIRTINQGRRYYFDALYGYIGYHLFCYMNSSFFDHFSDIGQGVLTDPSYRPESIYLEHSVSAGFELGHYVSYLFFKRLSFDFNYHVLNERFTISLSSGF